MKRSKLLEGKVIGRCLQTEMSRDNSSEQARNPVLITVQCSLWIYLQFPVQFEDF